MKAFWRTTASLIAVAAFSYFQAAGADAQQPRKVVPASSKTQPDSLLVEEQKTTQSIGDLVRDSNSPLPSSESSYDKLQKARELLRAATNLTTMPAPKNEFPAIPNVNIVTPEAKAAATRPAVEQQAPKASEKDLEMLKQLSATVFYSPLALADQLYSRGRLDVAAIFYDMAANQVAVPGRSIKLLSKEDKAWAFYQLGNCLRAANTAEARKAYKKVVDEFAESIWKELADRQISIIDWDLANKPEQELKKVPVVRAYPDRK